MSDKTDSEHKSEGVDNPARPKKLSSVLSRSAIQILLCRQDGVSDPVVGASATAFFWAHEGRLYLVTNWHNVTGWDPIRERSLHDLGFEPNFLRYHLDFVDGSASVRRTKTLVPLFDGSGKPLWKEHPLFGRKVDVVSLDVGPLPEGLFTQPINTFSDFQFDVQVGDDAFVLGFPAGLDGGKGFPIWKRASIASEPDFDMDNLPKLLVDTATRKGMSGAPVIAVRRGLIPPKGETNILAGNSVIGEAKAFLGAYSGREGDDPLGVQLGIVWKATAVREVIEAGAAGTSPWP